MNRMRAAGWLKIRSAAASLLVAGVLALLPAARLAAQECLRPSGTHANWAALGSGVAAGSHTAVTLEAGRNFLPDLAVFGELDGLVWNGGELLPTRRSLRFTGAYRFQAATKESDTLLDAVALCVTAAPEHVWNGDLKVLHIPVGLVVSTEWQSASGKWRVVPHVEPRLGYRRGMVQGFSQSSGAIALRLGVTAGIDRYFGGLNFHRPLTSGDAWTARLRFGLEF
jgi:hypothetical protein